VGIKVSSYAKEGWLCKIWRGESRKKALTGKTARRSGSTEVRAFDRRISVPCTMIWLPSTIKLVIFIWFPA